MEKFEMKTRITIEPWDESALCSDDIGEFATIDEDAIYTEIRQDGRWIPITYMREQVERWHRAFVDDRTLGDLEYTGQIEWDREKLRA